MQVGKYLGWLKVGVFGAVLALALAGCTEPTPTGKLPDPPSSAASAATDSSAATPTASVAPTTTYTPEEQAVIDQYKGYYNAFYSMPALDEANIRAAFGPYTSTNYLTQLLNGFVTLYADKGHHPSGEVIFGELSVVIAGGEANVVECRDGTSELVVADADGSVVGQGRPHTLYETRLNLVNGKWLVTKTNTVADSC